MIRTPQEAPPADVAGLLALREGTTPGPWEFWQGRFPESDIEDPDNFGVSTSDGGIITYAFPTDFGAGGDTKANARLIAAAPDMLDAIEAQAREIAALTARAEAAEAKVGRLFSIGNRMTDCMIRGYYVPGLTEQWAQAIREIGGGNG